MAEKFYRGKNYYKNRILYFIINNSGEFGASEIAKIFGFSKRTIQYFVEEYNKIGFQIQSHKGKYYIKKYPENFKIIKDIIENEEIKKISVYGRLKEMCGDGGSIYKKSFIDTYLTEYNAVTESTAYLNKLLNELKKEGYIFIENSIIYTTKNFFDEFRDEEILALLMYINIMKNIYPRGGILHDIFYKILIQFEKRGLVFEKDAVVYSHKNKTSFYDEGVLYQIEQAIYKKKKIKFKYKIKNGEELFEITPKGIIYSGFKDAWYLVEPKPKNRFFRLDRIVHFEIIDKDAQECGFDKIFYKASLGMSSETVIEVEVKFDKENFILRKLEDYKKVRETAVIIEEENSFLLKDKVCGINEFLKWVKSFGDSAECIKPDKLRTKLRNELELLRKRYEES